MRRLATTLVACLALGGGVVAGPRAAVAAPPLDLTPVAPSGRPALTALSPFETALELVLRTACEEGTDDGAFLRGDLGDEQKAVRDQVLAACARVRLTRLGALGPQTGPDRSGRARVIFFGSVYGAVAGLEAEIALHMSFDDPRYYVLPPLLGMGLGLTTAVMGTREGELTAGQAWTIISGFDYGSYLGLLWSSAAGANLQDTMAISLATGLSGGVGAIAAAKTLHPSQGDAEIFRSGGFWGTASGLFLHLLLSSGSSAFEDIDQSMALGMTLGLGTGAMLARKTELSRNRVLLIDTGALIGSLVGVCSVWLARGTDLRPRLLGGGGLLGLATGLGAAAWLTRDMDESEGPESTASLPTTRGLGPTRGGTGGWPLPMALPPQPSPFARAVVFEVPLLAGTF